jgi:4-amino-4-deoxy-L-arabinose transferase-like glycosyltransferase
MLLFSTPQGLGLNDDSIAYIAGARGLLSGQGYRELWLVSAGPVTHFPPGFSGALAGLGLLTGLDPLRGARLLNAALFGLNVFLSGWLGWRMTARPWIALAAALLIGSTPALLEVHSNAMSEPLYIAFTLLVFLILDHYFKLPAPAAAWLVAAGCLIGLAYLTRYAALALLATAVASLVLLQRDWRTRLTGSAWLTAGFLPWAAAWALRNRLVGGELTNRGLAWHPITPENAHTGVRTFAGFLMPVDAWQLELLRIQSLFEIVLTLLTLGLLLWVVRTGLPYFLRPQSAPRPEPIPLLNGLYVLGYFAALVLSMTFFDPATRFQPRILAPLFVSLLLLLSAGLDWLHHRAGKTGAAFVVAGLLLGLSFAGQAENLQMLRRGGQVYANARWFDATILDALRSLPPEVAIHTDQPGVVYLYVGRAASLLPESQAGFLSVKENVMSGRAVIALFRSVAMDEATLAYYDALSGGLQRLEFGIDVLYSAPGGPAAK